MTGVVVRVCVVVRLVAVCQFSMCCGKIGSCVSQFSVCCGKTGSCVSQFSVCCGKTGSCVLVSSVCVVIRLVAVC